MFEIRQTDTYRKWESQLRDRRALLTVTNRLDRLAAGNLGDTRSVASGVSELRIHYGPGYRIYFTRRGREIVVLLCGGDKSSQPRDIELAKQLARNLE